MAETRKEIGSRTAKDGFSNEEEAKAKLIQWKTDPEAKIWLEKMNYDFSKITKI